VSLYIFQEGEPIYILDEWYIKIMMGTQEFQILRVQLTRICSS